MVATCPLTVPESLVDEFLFGVGSVIRIILPFALWCREYITSAQKCFVRTPDSVLVLPTLDLIPITVVEISKMKVIKFTKVHIITAMHDGSPSTPVMS